MQTLDNYRKRIGSADAAVLDRAASSHSITFVPLELVEQPAVARQEVRKGATLFVELAGALRIGVVSGIYAPNLCRQRAMLLRDLGIEVALTTRRCGAADRRVADPRC